MKTRSRYPTLLQIDVRHYLSERAAALGRPATLDDIPDIDLGGWAEAGFDLIWCMGAWQTGPAGRRVSATHPEWLEEYRRALPDFQASDVCGSCFAIQDYRGHAALGGDEALDRLRRRLNHRGLRLILDFVPNHTALDHRWTISHPDYYINGNEAQLTDSPGDYCRITTPEEVRILAHGRDPYFPAWPDTLQLNYGNPDLRAAMRRVLHAVALRCDGVRCDMAMLILPEVFERTWGIRTEPFWPGVTQRLHAEMPGFLFLAEVYWDLEWTLQQQGFDYTYDKRLYDRLRALHARPVREHLLAGSDFQDRLARFLENHDEPRAAAVFTPPAHRAAATVTYLAPGLRFFHHGQLQGRKVRVPVHLERGPAEPVDAAVADFYQRLLACLRDPAVRDGGWVLLACRPAWDGNHTAEDFVAYAWSGRHGEKYLVAVNLSDHPGQCYVTLSSWNDLGGKTWRLRDRMGMETHLRDGDDLQASGLYLDVPAWACHVFAIGEARDTGETPQRDTDQ
ncbi:alpha-amylase family glycosyl hydrolase [Nitrosovibrio sp. Nv17]|uniref:alpha-amylase family glycosyl hydrolase n=1 Tax=Nitrosovibrio sp. Nv17 TaxID=1855339 RepID=UPI000908778D|nr:alpha-amylase family glycosyl hydrolase [Nitrosovibrio sp. Nv17]SFW29120.1 Alpha amylase, catalytic domain [Nitrosovibrio sp. Nv17]